MANKRLFQSTIPGKTLPKTDAINEAGGRAYLRSAEAKFAQYAVTGCLNSTFYSEDKDQLKTIMALAENASSQFIAQTAIYAREQGFMKDTPALLTAILYARTKTDASARPYFQAAFGRCIDNGKMLKNFVQIVRSGVVGRKSLAASSLRKLVQKWFNGYSNEQLVYQSVGNNPSLADVIRLCRVDPAKGPYGGQERRALFNWLCGVDPGQKEKSLGFTYDPNDLPQLIKDYEAWKHSTRSARPGKIPNVPFQMVTALDLSQNDWEELGRNMTWNQTKKNLNTLKRHGVFSKPKNVKMVADRLSNKELVEKAKVFPYELMTAYNATVTQSGMPQQITLALQKALEHSLRNIPEIEGQVVLAPDMSGSMGGPVTGNRDDGRTGIHARYGRASGATTVVRCRDAAALITAAFLRKLPDTLVLPFSDRINEVRLNPMDSIATNTRYLAALPAGGTDCSLPLRYLNDRKIKADLVIYVSDYESWMDTQGRTNHRYGWGANDVQQVTGMMAEWRKFKARNPKARLVCVDLQPSPTGQVINEPDILSLGGWNDTCFKLIADFARNGNTGDAWVKRIEAQPLFEVKTAAP